MARATPWASALLVTCLGLLACGDSGSNGADTAVAADTSVAGDTTAAADTATGTNGCALGALGCECAADGTCARGQCVAGLCALCTRGDDGCLCRADQSCKGELLCREGLCETCPPGQLGCACDGESCSEGGACQDGVCAPVDCAPGTADCPCRRRTAPVCDAPLSCLGDGVCHACAADRPGCACAAADTCAAGLLCDGSSCREPRSCATLVAEGFCGEHVACTATAGLDAECHPDECEPGYVMDRGRCVAGAPNCRSDAPGSMLDVCTSRLRQCDEAGGTASCGACIDDAREIDGECVGRLACGAGSCLNSQYCDATGTTPTCRELPCAAGEAMGTDGVCRACGFTCAGTGLSGRVWPFRTNTSTCVCETVRGFFMPPGGDTRPEVCDIDGDGWVREEVRDPALTSDPALTANARCDLVEVTSVLLRDEFGIDREVVSCEEGLIVEPDPTQCFDRVLMPLIESLRNDTPGPLEDTTTPAYGGRRLRAEEVNGLTKACVSALADYDDDGVEDLLEVQTPPSKLGDDPRARLRSFAYFMETHRAYVERDTARVPRLVIEERYRCDANDFPLRYDPAVTPSPEPTDSYLPGDGATYWRSCTRGTDPAYDPDADPPQPGFDFAQWSCPDGGAGCDSIAPGAPSGDLDLRTPIEFGTAFPEDATLCELRSRFPVDRVWRGMNHSSQFKCVGIGEGLGRRPASDFGPFGPLVMNLCEATACDPNDSGCAEARPVVPGASSLDPIITCRAANDVDSSDVGFAALRYQPYGVGFGGGYQGGCISEDAEYHDTLCPEPVFTVDPDDDAFGANTCYVAPCPFGKADCDGDPLNGCELNATTTDNCNGCGVPCRPKDGVGDCSTGLCRVVSCSTNRMDCDNDAGNGCETNTTTLDNCGDCDNPCTVDSGNPTCASGVCAVDSCDAGFAVCPGSPDCQSVRTADLCGECGKSCHPANVTTSSCATGQCVYGACLPGFGDCDGDPRNGCERALTDVNNCGACGRICFGIHSTQQCLGGTCSTGACSTNYGDCTSAGGCETDLRTSVDHCGSCGNACSPPGATEAKCVASKCAVKTCAVGRADCDNDAVNGCEVNNDNLGTSGCGTALTLGTFNGDNQCGAFCAVSAGYHIEDSKTGNGETWFKATVDDNNGICSGVLHHRLTLNMPATVDYDLRAYSACGGTLLASATTGGLGATEVLIVEKDDRSLDDESFSYWLEIRWHAGSSCDEWSLTIEGTRCGE